LYLLIPQYGIIIIIIIIIIIMYIIQTWANGVEFFRSQ